MTAQLQSIDETYSADVRPSFEIERCAMKPFPSGFPHILGNSAALRNVLDLVRMVGPSDATVLISGESGTGKELIARAIHDYSGRTRGPFVKVNCAAIPAGLLESELFGHERGAFTGAFTQRIGRFESANRGTLFLDEIGELPLELQAKFLRVLQEREFERLGGSRTLRADTRVVAATNCDLNAMVGERRFRPDLYYRLNVFPIELPPLRDRVEDIPTLVRHFLEQFSRRMNKRIDTIPPAVMDALRQYHWPGNIRELQNTIERAVILARGPVLTLPARKWEPAAAAAIPKNLRATLHDIERQRILSALEQANWKVSGPNGAAVLLGVKRTTLMSRMQKLGIDVARKSAIHSCAAAGANY